MPWVHSIFYDGLPMFTLRSHRLRRGPYALAASDGLSSRLAWPIVAIVIVAGLLLLARGFLRWIGSSNVVQRSAVILTVQPGGPVNVAIEGGSLKRAEDSLKLYEGDRIETGAGGRAKLDYFDGSVGYLDELSVLSVEESSRGSEQSSMHQSLSMGGMWMKTSDAASLSGSLLTTISTSGYTAVIPTNAEVIVRNRSLLVFAADGPGVSVQPSSGIDGIIIGEGQQWDLPENAEAEDDLYAYRSRLSPEADKLALVVRARTAAEGKSSKQPSAPARPSGPLSVTLPRTDSVVAGDTVRVEGIVDASVQQVRINGYQAMIDVQGGTFSQELSIGAEESFRIHVEAIDVDGVVIAEEQLVVKHARAEGAPAPLILEPATSGSTYRTQDAELLITGTAAKNVEAIMVNDYRLQLYEPGSGRWSYLASTALGNLKPGSNVYDVIAIDASGAKSPPSRITILLEDGQSGVVDSSAGAQQSSGATQAQIDDETLLPSNEPLAPGVLRITGPSTSSPFMTGSGELLLEGVTSAKTASMWVNGYRLRLYLPGKTTWNYIASASLGTLKRGDNAYAITARNEKGEVLDRMSYTIQYVP